MDNPAGALTHGKPEGISGRLRPTHRGEADRTPPVDLSGRLWVGVRATDEWGFVAIDRRAATEAKASRKAADEVPGHLAAEGPWPGCRVRGMVHWTTRKRCSTVSILSWSSLSNISPTMEPSKMRRLRTSSYFGYSRDTCKNRTRAYALCQNTSHGGSANAHPSGDFGPAQALRE
jgi:hypothetical protein